MTIYDRWGGGLAALVHHSDHGSQYLSMRYADRLAEAVERAVQIARRPTFALASMADEEDPPM